MRKLVLEANKLSRNTQLTSYTDGLNSDLSKLTMNYSHHFLWRLPLATPHVLLQPLSVPSLTPVRCGSQSHSEKVNCALPSTPGPLWCYCMGEPLSIHTCVTKIFWPITDVNLCLPLLFTISFEILFIRVFRKPHKISTSCRHPELIPPLPWFYSCCPSFLFPGTTSQINNLCARLCLGLCFWWHRG